MTAGLVVTAFALGLRHGIDWDHIAAISDLTGTARGRRRGVLLSLLYAIGHAAVVLMLGAIAILFGAALPAGLDAWMGRVVGATLVFLGIWVLVGLARRGSDFRLRSRWMLIIDGTFAGFRRVRERMGTRRITVEHAHPHEHHTDDHIAVAAHDHAHHTSTVKSPAPVGPPRPHGRPVTGPSTHSHRHDHSLVLPNRSTAGYGAGTATGIGMLHGVGIESPTQIAIFVASTSVAGRGAGILLLAFWVIGLVVANAGIAVLAAFGSLRAEGNARLYRLVALVVAIGSLTLGLVYLGGLDILPEIGA